MGIYTQVRGSLHVGHAGSQKENATFHTRLENTKQAFQQTEAYREYRTWVADDTLCHIGSNSAVFLFFGTELKNQNQEAERWILFLLHHFPEAKGRIDFTYQSEPASDTYWLINNGKVTERGTNSSPLET